MEENKNNELFKETISFLLNPYIVTGLSSKKINKNVEIIKGVNYTEHLNNGYDKTDIRNLFEYIKENNTGRDLDISVCKSYYKNFDPEMQNFIKSILTKSLKIGANAKTINGVFGSGFIPTFDCMLAEKYFEHTDFLDEKDFSITLKLDGIRCLAIKENGKTKFFSRQGQSIEGLVDIEEELNLFDEDDYVLDGELLITDTASIPSKEQYKATTKIVRKDGEKHGITYRVFDLISVSEFKKQSCQTTYNDRRFILNKLFNNLVYTQILPVLYSGSETSMILEILDQVRKEDQEGIMINLNDAHYEFKRTKNLLKCKVMSDCDLKIVGFENGNGRLSNTLGRLNVEYKNHIVGVGSGFSDEDRNYFWTHKDELLGRVVTVQYFEETKDKEGKLSLRFPVFKELREQGKEVSYF